MGRPGHWLSSRLLHALLKYFCKVPVLAERRCRGAGLQQQCPPCFLSGGSPLTPCFSLSLLWFDFCLSHLILLCCSVAGSYSSWPHGLQHARLLCPSLSPRMCTNSCQLIGDITFSSSATSFSFYPQSFSASGSFPTNWPFASRGQSIGTSASLSVLPMNIQDWFPLGLTGSISLQSKGLWRVCSNTAVQKHRFFGTQPS